LPRISIIIPTLNEERYIGQTLQCVLDNDIPTSDLEVILIDSASRDGTVKVAQKFADRLPLRIIEAPGCSVYRALNIGLKAARGKYFVRVDARSAIPRLYIETCIDHLCKLDAQCVGGVQFQYGETLVSESIANATSSKFGTGGAKFRTAKQSGFVDSVYLGVYRTDTLLELGGFEDRGDYVSEDALINKRIIDRGGRVYLDSQLKVRYPAKETFRALAKQYIIYGAAKAFVLRRYYFLTSIRQLVPLLFLLTWLALALTCATGVLSWTTLIAALGAYVLLVVAASLSQRVIGNQSGGSLWASCIATICIHFSWPTGFFLFLICPPLHKKLVNKL
jgi:glycosyltransferase involved in cell wall biosynthesis